MATAAATGKTVSRFLTARWEDLLFLNYPIDPAALQPRVPAGTELDFHDGQTFVSVVGFRFLKTRVKGIPIPMHRNFPEVNLRFYVRRRADGGWRRGVVFVKEVVPRRAIAWVARRLYRENYVRRPMWSRAVRPDGEQPGEVEYGFRTPAGGHFLRAEFAGAPAAPADGGEEAFITEHYHGYSAQPDGSTKEYQVEHPRWRVWPAAEARLELDAAEVYGPEFVGALSRPPSSAFIADGSGVSVYGGVTVS